MSKDVIRIANCSGYYGDKLSAAKEMIDGGPIDVLTGDYLAEINYGYPLWSKSTTGRPDGLCRNLLKTVKRNC